MRIKRKRSFFIRRGHRIWFYDIVQPPSTTSVMTTALRRRRTTRTSTRQYWSTAQDSSQDLGLTLANPMQSRSLIYPSLSYRRLTLRRSKTARPRSRPRKASSATPIRTPNDVLAAYKASCMRKSRRQGPLNVGEMQITSTHIHFTAHYLNSAPGDAQVSLPFDGIIHIRRACYRRVLPHGVLIRCQGFPDYLMVLADRQQQADVLYVLGNALRNVPDSVDPLPSTSDRLFAYDSSTSLDKDSSTEREPSMEREAPDKLEERTDANANGTTSEETTEKNESIPRSSIEETCSCRNKPNSAAPESDKVGLQSLQTMAFAAKTMSQGKLLLLSGPEQFKTLANDLLRKGDGTVDEDFMASTILLISAALLLCVTLGVVVAISSLRTRVVALSSLLTSSQQ